LGTGPEESFEAYATRGAANRGHRSMMKLDFTRHSIQDARQQDTE
jgi:hypothetical protein